MARVTLNRTPAPAPPPPPITSITLELSPQEAVLVREGLMAIISGNVLSSTVTEMAKGISKSIYDAGIMSTTTLIMSKSTGVIDVNQLDRAVEASYDVIREKKK